MDISFIFHMGIYNVPGFDTGIQKRKVQNGSEWYMKRLLETTEFRPVSGSKQTKEHHQKVYGEKKYEEFSKDFTLSKWGIDAWMAMCKEVNPDAVVIITARHHDGYCLFPTKTTRFNATETGPGFDVVQRFKEAALKHGLKFGVYYSWSEFFKGFTVQYINSVVIPQVRELMAYDPKVWWFDGHWFCKTKAGSALLRKLCLDIKAYGGVVNDRIGEGNVDLAEFRVHGDRFLPEEKQDHLWQHITTVGLSWGMLKQGNVYKTTEQIVGLYQQVKQKGGTFLLNLASDELGRMDPEEWKVLKELSEVFVV